MKKIRIRPLNLIVVIGCSVMAIWHFFSAQHTWAIATLLLAIINIPFVISNK